MAAPQGALEFRVAQPLTGSPPHPCLVLLHGRGSNELDLLPLGHELDPRLLVVTPRAPHALGLGSFYWYDLEAALVGRPSRDSLEDSLELVAHLFDEIEKSNDIDVCRLILGGFSMGGAMTAAMLLTSPQRLRGAMILSGYVPIHTGLDWKPEDLAGKPVFQAHGLYDDVLPLQFGRMSRDYLQKTPVELTYREYPMGHQVSQPELADARGWIQGLL